MTTTRTPKSITAKLNPLMKVAIVAAFISMAVPFVLTNFILPANPLSITEIMSANVAFAYVTVASAVLLAVGAVKRFLDNK